MASERRVTRSHAQQKQIRADPIPECETQAQGVSLSDRAPLKRGIQDATSNSHSSDKSQPAWHSPVYDAMMPELDVKEIPGKNNGSAIAAALDTIMAEWGVVKEFCCRTE
ncbi:hypothetical protein PPTG_24258 [Phytophthora nicotianae INRA-310]|uniref:Uncharacterized protein n=1 Tax=Phytophthora nicotianae (strain INRA-310) TaxID=761204 RepID=W2PHA7_PHYN3|nr:hypothetical protein PPTG_24258 [Phytophthora nicotianae INRA-310]ETN00398.1 hypothetical protein PPTG_24258 [Phytophthora nicotianae INRA-310]